VVVTVKIQINRDKIQNPQLITVAETLTRDYIYVWKTPYSIVKDAFLLVLYLAMDVPLPRARFGNVCIESLPRNGYTHHNINIDLRETG
jgi:hypothetical protein